MHIAQIAIVMAIATSGALSPTDPPPIASPHTAYGTFCVPLSAIPRTLPAKDTLITGDIVAIRMTSSGCLKVDITQQLPGETIRVNTDARGHLFAIPAAVEPVIAASLDDGGMVDRRIFDVTAHIDDEYDDSTTSFLPLTLMYKDLVTANAVAAGTSGVFGDTLLDKHIYQSISAVAGDLDKTTRSGSLFRDTVAELTAARASGEEHAVYWIEYDHKKTLEW
jgi:hypothetical protein